MCVIGLVTTLMTSTYMKVTFFPNTACFENCAESFGKSLVSLARLLQSESDLTESEVLLQKETFLLTFLSISMLSFANVAQILSGLSDLYIKEKLQ